MMLTKTERESIIQELKGYNGNPKLLLAGEKYQYTKWEIEEIVKCKNDIHYFIENYVKIIHVDRGLIPFVPWDFQNRTIDVVKDNRFVICKFPRQSGKSTTIIAYILWYILFNENVKIAILAHRLKTARDLFSKVRTSYEHLPKFLQAGIAPGGWNKGSIILGNGSIVMADATTGGSIRGESFNCISGKEKITLKLDDQEFTISLEQFHSIIANSSKYNINKDEIVLGEIDESIFEQQIYQMVYGYNYSSKTKHIGKSTIFDRVSSYHSKMLEWGRFIREFGLSDITRTFNCSSALAKNGEVQTTSNQTILCISPDGEWTAKYYDESNGGPKENLYEKLVGCKFEVEERIDTLRTNKTKNQRHLEKENRCRLETKVLRQKPNVRRNQKENIKFEFGENRFGFNKRKDFQVEYWKISRDSFIRRTQDENREFIGREVQDQRTHGENKQKSRKDQKNSGKTSWYEKIVGIKTKNVPSSEGQGSLEQRLKIKTTAGWETFKGIKRTRKQQTINLLFDNGKSISCTPNHRMETINGWVCAKDITEFDNIITDCGITTLNSMMDNVSEDVFDILHTSKTNSFFVNGISVHNCVLLDEFAFVDNNLAKEFMESVYPTISSGTTTKIIIVSTPHGMNHYYEMWEAARLGRSEFVPIEVKWNEVPGRDEAWKQKQIKNTNLQSWLQEFECAFLGSSTTLLSADALEYLLANVQEPIKVTDNMNIYEEPKDGYVYALTVDVSRGQGLDYQAFSVTDVTNFPYKQVLTFRDNKMSPTVYPTLIKSIAEKYNYAHILVEISDIGGQVADMLVGDLDTENVIRVRAVPGKGQFIGFGVGGKVYNGLKTSPATKRIGCADLKTLIENHKLLVPDRETVKEFTTFVADTQSFAAEEGKHDDLVMSLVLFGWLSHQRYFRQETQDIRAHLEEENQKYLDSQMTPFGIIDDGTATFYHDYA